jgi:hypothetical protein
MARPMSETTAFIQLDDLTEAKLDRLRPVAFLTVQTSPGNHQAWIAVRGFADDQDRKDFARRVKKQVTADSLATGSVRLAVLPTSKLNTSAIFRRSQYSIPSQAASLHRKRSNPSAWLLRPIPPPP